jgi:hypothetical protein
VGHDHHFLSRLDRVSDAQVELALGLYRDHHLLRAVLDLAKLPEGAERVAISLDDARLGPFIVVARDGGFVTCLGRGMSSGALPIISRGQLDAISHKLADLRARIDFAQTVVKTKGEQHRLMQRIQNAGHTLCREDFVAISAWAPLLAPSFYIAALDTARLLEYDRGLLFRGGKRAGDTELREAYGRMFAIGHLLLLATMGDKDFLQGLDWEKHHETISSTASDQSITALSLKGAWAAAELGKPLLGSYKARFATQPPVPERMFDSLLGMLAIATRHANTASEVEKAFAAAEHAVPAAGDEPTLLRWKGDLAALARKILTGEESEKRTILIGQDMCVTLSKDADGGSPFQFKKPEDVPEDIAVTAVLTFRMDILEQTGTMMSLFAAPYAARAKPEDFYFPRHFIKAYGGEWWPERAAELLQLAGSLRYRSKKPVESKKTAGRNDPCPCGSGKKYKKCHGAGT